IKLADAPCQCLQPGPSVLVVERHAGGHLVDVGPGVELVTLDEDGVQLLCHGFTDRRLAGAGDTHDDDVPGRLHYRTSQRTAAIAKTVRPSVVSMTVHVLRVVFSSIPKKRLTSQKPESLTCESTVAPAATAKTSRATLTSLRPS